MIVPSQTARRLFFFRTSVSVLQFLHFSIFHLSSHAQFTCSWGCYSYDVRADITVQICKLAESAKKKQNQEINKPGTLSHGVSEVTILHNSKLELHHMTALDLLILQKLEFTKTGMSPHGISGFADSTRTRNSTKLECHHMASLDLLICKNRKSANWNFTTRYLWSCHSCGPAY